MKARGVIRKLEADGWVQVKSKGHLQYVHPIKPGRVTVPFHGSADLAKGTLSSIFKQAGWK